MLINQSINFIQASMYLATTESKKRKEKVFLRRSLYNGVNVVIKLSLQYKIIINRLDERGLSHLV